MPESVVIIDSSEIHEGKLSGIDIYGEPSRDLLERLRRKARLLGSGSVVVHELHAGFARFSE